MSFYLVTGLPMNLNSSLPGNHLYQSIISLHVHHDYINIAQNIWVLSYGQIFSCICASPLGQWLARTVYQIADFLSGNFADFPALFCIHISTFSLILKGCNIEQDLSSYLVKFYTQIYNIVNGQRALAAFVFSNKPKFINLSYICRAGILGIRSSVFWANCSFFAKKWANKRFAQKTSN